MTSEEKFMFDLEGYLVVKNVLTPREVADMNATADEVFPSNYDETGARGVSGPRPHTHTPNETKKTQLLRWASRRLWGGHNLDLLC